MIFLIWMAGITQLVNGEKFPIHEFMNKSLEADLDHFMCSSDSYQKCCDCSEGCMKNKDCCIDYLWNEKTYKSLNDYINYFLQESSKYKDRSCVQLVPNQESEAYYMVTTCFVSSSSVEWKRCTDFDPSHYDTFLPVVDSNNILYRNIYCAQCNEVSSFKHVTVSAFCENKNTRSNDTMTILERFTSCSFSLNFNAEWSCYINQNLNRDCDLKNPLYQLCRSYRGQVEYSYANYHCFQCNTQDYKYGDNYGASHCPPRRGPPVASKYGWSITLSYSGYASIKNLNRFDEDFLKEEEVKVCNKNESYDIIQKKCLPITCSYGYQYNGEICEKVLQPDFDLNIIDPKFESCLAASKPTLFVQVKSENFNVTIIQQHFSEIFGSQVENFEVYTNLSLLTLKRSLALQEYQYDLLKNSLRNSTNGIWNYIDKVFVSHASSPIVTHQYGFDISRTFPGQKLCYDLESIAAVQVNFTSQCNLSFKNLTFSWRITSPVISFANNSIQQNLSVCQTYHLQSSCALQKITSNFSMANGVLLVLQGRKNLTFQPSNYIPLEAGFGVCIVNGYTTSNWREVLSKVDYYIALVGCSLNIACYLVVLITYGYYKELQNLPGRCLFQLSGVLLLADISFLVGVHNNEMFTVCKMFSIFLHWCMLTVLMWTMIISLNIAVHVASFSVAKSQQKKTFLKYCLVAFGIPTVTVTLTVILDETSTVLFAYGRYNICWIREFYPLLYSYIIPALVGYLLTFLGLVCTLYGVLKNSKQNSEALGNSRKEKVVLLKIALKLVCILGVSEGIGFIQIHKVRLSNNELVFNVVFGVCYGILRSIRGLLLVIVYIFTKKIIGLYRQSYQNNVNFLQSSKSHTAGLTISMNSISKDT